MDRRGIGTQAPGEFDPLYPKSNPDYQGIIRLAAGDLARTLPFEMIESATTFRKITVGRRTMRLFCPGQTRVINYMPYPAQLSMADHLTRKMHASSASGYADLPEGDWLVNTPIITAEGTKVEFMLQDAALGSAFDPGVSVGSSSSDVTVADTPTFVSVPNADTALLAADPLRKLIILVNPDAAISIWLKHGAAAAVAGSGNRIPPNGAIVIGDSGDAVIAGQALRGIGTAAGPVLVGIQTYR